MMPVFLLGDVGSIDWTGLRPFERIVVATIGSYEVKTNVPALLKRVEAGETLTITRHGRPIPRIVPIADLTRFTRREAVERLREFGKGRTLRRAAADEGVPSVWRVAVSPPPPPPPSP